MEITKTVAIITMHRVLNYGSILQTLALCKYLESIGFNPVVVDYKFPNNYHKSVANRGAVCQEDSWFRMHLNGLCNRIIKPSYARKASGFYDIFKHSIRVTKPYENEEQINRCPVEADIYLTGSDQVWNPRWTGKDLTFLLSWVPENKKKIAYGASFGSKTLTQEQLSYFEPWLKKYDVLSVRENNDILPRIGLKNQVVLDPTFLLNKKEWHDIVDSEPIVTGKYILCYLIGYSFNPFPYAYDVIRYVKQRTKYKVVLIAGEPLNILKGYILVDDKN